MSNPIILTFDYASFIATFPMFSNAVKFPQATLQMYWDMGTSYISDVNYGWLQCQNRQLALNLLTAHLAQLYILINCDHQVPNLMQTATIDKITVGLTPPPIPNQWQWWLNQTGYGQQLLALLQANSVGGFYIGGSPVLDGFRGAYGQFGIGGFPNGSYPYY